MSNSLTRICTPILLSASVIGGAFARQNVGHSPVNPRLQAKAEKLLKQSSNAFVRNDGQWRSQAKFLSRRPNLNVWIESDGLTFDFHKAEQREGKYGLAGQVVKMKFDGSLGASSVGGFEKINHVAKFLPKKGGKPVEAPYYSQVYSHGIYPGIDLHTYSSGNNVQYDFNVAPGADSSQVKLKFSGAKSIGIQSNKLTVGTQIGNFAQADLEAYQMVSGKKVSVAASFVKEANGDVGFKVGAYDHSKALTIDPVVYGSYFGGNGGWDEVHSVAADASGGVYITGSTQSTDFPVTAGPYFVSLKGAQNAFMAKLQGDAYNVDYSVYFGGSNSDSGQFIRLDQFGNVWVAGITTSPDFPGNSLPSSPSNQDIFLIRFEKSTTLVLDPVTNPATLMIGGAGQEFLNGFSIVPEANPQPTDPVQLLLAGHADMATPQVPNGAFNAPDGFILRYNFVGGGFIQDVAASTYIGEGLPVVLSGLDVDTQGYAYVTGQVGDGQTNVDTSTQPGFTTTANTWTGARLVQKTDLFVRKYDSAGTIVYSGVVGGSGIEIGGANEVDETGAPYIAGSCIAVDNAGNAYITGTTSSFDYPRTRGVFGEIFNGTPTVVVTKISADASQILYSTNLKTQGGVYPDGIAVDLTGQAYVTGMCEAPNNPNFYDLIFPFPPGNPDQPTGLAGPLGTIVTAGSGGDTPPDTTYTTPNTAELPTSEGWLNVLDPNAVNLVYGTYLGGLLDEHMYGPYVDSFGDVWVFGATCANRTYFVGTTMYQHLGATLPAGLITNKAFKPDDSPDQQIPVFNVIYDLSNGIFINFAPGGESRDGFLVKFRVGRPIVSSVVVTPTTAPGGNGIKATVQVTLSSAAPPEGAVVAVTLSSTAAASFSSTSAVGSTSVTIPSGATTFATPITIYTEPVSANTQVLVKADYQGNFLISPLNVIPWLQNLTVNPTGVVGGNTVTGTISLAQAAPTGGISVLLSSSNASISFPNGGTVTIPAGQTTANFPISTIGVDNPTFPTVTASFLGVTKTAAIELDPASLQKLILVPNEVDGGETVNGTVILNGLPGPSFPAIPITIEGSPSGYTINPSSITFSGTTGTFTISVPFEPSQVTRTVDAVLNTVPSTAYQAQTLKATFQVDVVNLVGFQVTPLTANPGDTLTGSVQLSNPAGASGITINLSSDTPSVIALPATELVNPGDLGETFPITVSNVAILMPTTVTLTATRGSNTFTQQVQVTESTVTLALNDLSVLGGATTGGTVTLSSPALTDTVVTLQTSPNGIVSSPTTIIIPAGSTTATFVLGTASVTTTQEVTVTAIVGQLTSNSVNLEVRAPGLVSISFLPSVTRGGRAVQCRVTLDGPAPAGGALISFTSGNPKVVRVPATAVIPAGKASYLFTVFVTPSRVSRALGITVTASYNGATTSTVLVVLR